MQKMIEVDFPKDPFNDSITEAREWVHEHKFDKGFICCPVCGQEAKAYKRSISSVLAYSLWLFINRGHNEWTHQVEFFYSHPKGKLSNANREFSRLVYWGLVVECHDEDKKKEGVTRSGYYKHTPLAEAFVFKGHLLIKNIWIYNKIAVRESGGYVSFKTCVERGGKFNFDDLINNV